MKFARLIVAGVTLYLAAVAVAQDLRTAEVQAR